MSNGIYLLLGSNLGAKFSSLEIARNKLKKSLGPIVKQSSLYETDAWGVIDQPSYLNQVIQIDTKCSPQELLFSILQIEKEMGRIREERWQSRTIDIDILFYHAEILDSEKLQIPHPRFHERNFALIPMMEIAPTFVHPVFQKSITELMNSSPDNLTVKRIEN